MKKSAIYFCILALVLLFSGCFGSSSGNDGDSDNQFNELQTKEICFDLFSISTDSVNAGVITPNTTMFSVKKAMDRAVKSGFDSTYTETIEGATGSCVVNVNVTMDWDDTLTSVTYVMTGTFVYNNFKETADSEYVYNGTVNFEYNATYSDMLSQDGMSGTLTEKLTTSDFTVNDLPYDMSMVYRVTFPDLVVSYSGSVNGDSFSGSMTLYTEE